MRKLLRAIDFTSRLFKCNMQENPFYAPKLTVNTKYKCPITEKIHPVREFNINGNKVFAKSRKEAIKIAVYKGFITDKKKK